MAVVALLALVMLGVSPFAVAGGWQCWATASERYGVPVDLMYAIARVESGNRSHIVGPRNGNGTYDIGLMQINSWWLPKLKRYGITETKLLADPCLNLQVGAWILSKTLHRYGFNWRGLGAYNASTDWKRARYARRVVAELQKIRREQGR